MNQISLIFIPIDSRQCGLFQVFWVQFDPINRWTANEDESNGMNELYLSELSLKDVEGAGPQVANIRRFPMNNWYWNSRRSLGVLPFDARTPLPRAAPLTVIGAAARPRSSRCPRHVTAARQPTRVILPGRSKTNRYGDMCDQQSNECGMVRRVKKAVPAESIICLPLEIAPKQMNES